MNSREDLLKAQITQSQKEIETNEKVANKIPRTKINLFIKTP